MFLKTDSEIYIIVIERLQKHLDGETSLDIMDMTEEPKIETNNSKSITVIQIKLEGNSSTTFSVTYSGHLGTQKNISFYNFFYLYLNKEYVEMTDAIMHLIISKWLRRQKCRQDRKTMKQKEIKTKEETVNESVFIHLNT